MALGMIPRLGRTAAIAIVVLCSVLSPRCAAQGASSVKVVPSITIDRFLTGVSLPREKEYTIDEFRLGDYRVTELFDVIPVDLSGNYSQLPNADALLVKAKNAEALAELKRKSFFSKNLRIDVVMVSHARRCRFLGGMLSAHCSSRIEIPFTINYATPCEEVTRVIYLALGSEMAKGVPLAGDSPAPIELDHIFSLLLVDKVVPFIQHLRPVDKNNSCFKEFALLKWLRNEEIEGFDRSDYAMHQGLRDVLRGIGGTLAGMRWERYHFEIELIGYADQSSFHQKARDLSQGETGIGDWSRIERPLAVYYKDCKGDHLLEKSPSSIAFGEKSTMFVGSEINDNCELGATRAYVATVFLINLLGTNNIEYKYGTGGIIETNDRSKDYLNRRVEIRVVAKSAGRRPSVRNIHLQQTEIERPESLLR